MTYESLSRHSDPSQLATSLGYQSLMRAYPFSRLRNLMSELLFDN